MATRAKKTALFHFKVTPKLQKKKLDETFPTLDEAHAHGTTLMDRPGVIGYVVKKVEVDEESEETEEADEAEGGKADEDAE